MNRYLKYIPHLFLGLIIILIYKSWLSLDLITSGDFWPYAKSQYETKTLFLYAWNLASASGLGGFVGPLLWIYLNFGIPLNIFGSWFGLSWEIIQRIYYLFPFLILSLFSSYKLFSKLFSNNRFSLLSSAIYLLNTYILMVIGGGQIPGVGIAYSILPLVLYAFLNVFEKLEGKSSIKVFNYSLIASLVLSLQLLFDIRIAYITLAAVAAYAVLSIMNYVISKETLKDKIRNTLYLLLYAFFIPGIFSVLLHFFWILTTIISHRNPVEQLGFAYSSLDAVKFFSFAKFENSISLLHPNWPENIFGKVGFMKPEFLLLPILAYSSLLFITNSKLKTSSVKVKNNLAIEPSNNLIIIFFALLGLIGAFLAKGASEPFGNIYLWMFNHIPGFIMFRDPSKWYTLVVLSYSILIPFTVWKIYEWIKSQSKFQILNFKFQIKSKNQILNFQNLFLLVVVFCFLYLIRPAILGELTGTFKTTAVPNEYIRLEKFLSSQKPFSRTLWLPTTQRFGFYSNNHPAIPAQNLFKTVENSQIFEKMRMQETRIFLQETGVKYVIVPYDSKGEIFLKDRKYDKDIYQKTINDVKQIPYLKQVSGFGKIAVFEATNPKDHFYISNQQSAISNQKITYQYVSPVEYIISIENAKIGDTIVFSENYDAGWFARNTDTQFLDWPNLIGSNPYNRIFNSFALKKSGNYSLDVYYYPQIVVILGSIISFASLVLILSSLLYLSKIKK